MVFMERVTRLVCIFAREWAKIKEWLGQASPAVLIRTAFHFSSPCCKKRKTTTFVVVFMERVTRLELATSTLARWRSTG